MADPYAELSEVQQALELAADLAQGYVAGIGEDPVQPEGSDQGVQAIGGSLPDAGDGTLAPLRELAEMGERYATRSSGGRFFHFVVGGTTPAALAADWLTSALDQNSGLWASSPLGARLEAIATDWLRDLFELPADFSGVLVTGGTMANFTCLAAARSWWAERHGLDIDEDGLGGAPAIPVFTTDRIHQSATKSLGLLGAGRSAVRRCTDVGEPEAGLRALDGAPGILVATAGEPNAAAFDPIAEMADLAERYGAWLHVDGAFGLFARLSPRTRHLTEGVERAQSVSSDGHKWLNVPHDCGFSFVRERRYLVRAFSSSAAYLPADEDERPSPAYISPEGSRRGRAFCVWATLKAYGRDGYREMVERHVTIAAHLAARVRAEPEFELLAEQQLNVVTFRWRPDGVPEEELDELNRRLGAELLRDGRVFAGTTIYEGRIAFRPAIVNWRTQEADVDLLVDVLLELAPALLARTG
ncbi:MAG TPA: pyridoxal-dependent decarboxylase [Thermoleophilaceae bacterium]|nr:pyridoxal-dependent decarboxylase [Thermoleophilaceae bacterium]